MNYQRSIIFLVSVVMLLIGCAKRIQHQESLGLPSEGKEQSFLVQGTENTSKCLPENTLISTLNGEIKVQELKVGDKIYSVDYRQTKIEVAILAVQKSKVPRNFEMLEITLTDGRKVMASPDHPNSVAYRIMPFSSFKINTVVDNTHIAKIDTVKYEAGFTYDILPDNEIADYWANGIRIGSSMYPSYYNDDPKLFLECIESTQSEISSGACCQHTSSTSIKFKIPKKSKNFEIHSINGFELKGLKIEFKKLVTDEFVIRTSKTTSSGIFDQDGGETNTSIKFHTEDYEFFKLNPGDEKNPPTRITKWPMRIEYSDCFGDHILILLQPDTSSSIYPP